MIFDWIWSAGTCGLEMTFVTAVLGRKKRWNVNKNNVKTRTGLHCTDLQTAKADVTVAVIADILAVPKEMNRSERGWVGGGSPSSRGG